MKNFKFYTLLVAILLCSGQSLHARSLNIGSKAKATASSSLNNKNKGSKINDGIIAVKNKGNWLVKSEDAWVELSWDKSQLINKVVIFNHPDVKSRVLKGKLVFSDGSSIEVILPNDGSAKAVEFKPTGGWEKEWKFVPAILRLKAGANNIRIETTGHSGPYIDELFID